MADNSIMIQLVVNKLRQLDCTISDIKDQTIIAFHINPQLLLEDGASSRILKSFSPSVWTYENVVYVPGIYGKLWSIGILPINQSAEF